MSITVETAKCVPTLKGVVGVITKRRDSGGTEGADTVFPGGAVEKERGLLPVLLLFIHVRMVALKIGTSG